MDSIEIKYIINFLKKKNFKFEFIGDEADKFCGFSPLNEYKQNTLTWVNDSKYFEKNKQNIDFIITSFKSNLFKNAIIVEDPKKIFFELLEDFFKNKKNSFISNTSYIGKNVRLGENVSIGHFCVIEDNVSIGDNTVIESDVFIGNDVNIGKHCYIQSGAKIGCSGFGFTQNTDGEYKRENHIGSVLLEDRVEIGNNTCVLRGTLGNTKIGEGSKIDSLCHIAHNVKIGKRNMILTGSSFYGSSETGNDCYIASAIIRNKIKIGDNVFVGMGSVVTKNIESGLTVLGVPARKK